MKAKDLRGLSVEELSKKEMEVKDDLFKLRFKHGIRRLENPSKLNQIRKDIARIQTILAEKIVTAAPEN